MKWAKRPFPGEDVFIVGEAYSVLTGWNEGALQSAYNALKEGWEITQRSISVNGCSCRGNVMAAIGHFLVVSFCRLLAVPF